MFALLWLTLLAGAEEAVVVVDGGTCVAQRDVDEGVAQRVPEGRPGRIEAAIVDLDGGDGVVAAVVTFPDGGRRRLSAGDCAHLTEQIAFVIALWRDPSLVLRPERTPPTAALPQSPPGEEMEPQQTTPSPPPSPPSPPQAASIAAQPSTGAPLVTLVVGAGASSLLAGPYVSVEVRSRGALWVRAGPRFEFSPPQQHGPAVLSLWAPSLAVDGCASFAAVWGCLGLNGGTLIAVPHDGLQAPQVGVVPLTAAGAAIGAALPLTATSALFAELGARVPLVPMTVAAQSTALWTSPVVAVHATVGALFDLP